MDTSFVDAHVDALLPFLTTTMGTPSIRSNTEDSTAFLATFLADLGSFKDLDEAFDMTPERLSQYVALYKETKSRCKVFTEAQWTAFEKAMGSEEEEEETVRNAEEAVEAEEAQDVHTVLRSLLGITEDTGEFDSPETIAQDLCREAAALDALTERLC